jgi:hypothetical protein
VFYSDKQFMNALCWLFGLVYFMLTFLMFNFGSRLYLILAAHNDSMQLEEINKTLSQRVVIITSVFTLVFVVRAVHNLFYTLNITQSFYPPDFWSALQWEALVRIISLTHL